VNSRERSLFRFVILSSTTINLALVLIAGLVPQTRGLLPLGGSELAQLGVTYGIPLVLCGFYSIICGGAPPFL
jgi:hypothetical protein